MSRCLAAWPARLTAAKVTTRTILACCLGRLARLRGQWEQTGWPRQAGRGGWYYRKKFIGKLSISKKYIWELSKNYWYRKMCLQIHFLRSFCASSWGKANGSLWPPPHLNGLLNYQWAYYALVVASNNFHFPTSLNQFWFPVKETCLGGKKGRARTFLPFEFFALSFFQIQP